MIYIFFPVSFLIYLFFLIISNDKYIANTFEPKEERESKPVVKEEKYEDKYWDKYNQCPIEYMFSEEDEETEKEKYNELQQNQGEQEEENKEKIKKEAHEYMKNKFLLKFKNSFILENTPLGNVSMCYNHEKESFEYYSDKTIPYRYLEPIARKYVSTFLCKKLYVNMEEELKEAKKKKRGRRTKNQGRSGKGQRKYEKNERYICEIKRL